MVHARLRPDGLAFNETYTYHNDQEAATIWYHDHALGITRLKVYAGLAGFFIVRDDNEDALVAADQLPTGPYEVPFVIQDPGFDALGGLQYPLSPRNRTRHPRSPSCPSSSATSSSSTARRGLRWRSSPVSTGFGCSTDQTRASTACSCRRGNRSPDRHGRRPARCAGDDGSACHRAGRTPGRRHRLLWAGVVGLDDHPPDTARAPYPKGDAADSRTVGQIMAFKVTKPLDISSYPLTTLPTDLRPVHGPIVPLPAPVRSRKLLLFEGEDDFGRRATPGYDRAGRPRLGRRGHREPWPSRHRGLGDPQHHCGRPPDHLHEVAFQVLDRQKFQADQAPSGALRISAISARPSHPLRTRSAGRTPSRCSPVRSPGSSPASTCRVSTSGTATSCPMRTTR